MKSIILIYSRQNEIIINLYKKKNKIVYTNTHFYVEMTDLNIVPLSFELQDLKNEFGEAIDIAACEILINGHFPFSVQFNSIAQFKQDFEDRKHSSFKPIKSP